MLASHALSLVQSAELQVAVSLPKKKSMKGRATFVLRSLARSSSLKLYTTLNSSKPLLQRFDSSSSDLDLPSVMVSLFLSYLFLIEPQILTFLHRTRTTDIPMTCSFIYLTYTITLITIDY